MLLSALIFECHILVDSFCCLCMSASISISYHGMNCCFKRASTELIMIFSTIIHSQLISHFAFTLVHAMSLFQGATSHFEAPSSRNAILLPLSLIPVFVSLAGRLRIG